MTFPQPGLGLERERNDNGNGVYYHCILIHRLADCPTVTPQEKAEIYRRINDNTFVWPTPRATTGVGGVANPSVSGGTPAPAPAPAPVPALSFEQVTSHRP